MAAYITFQPSDYYSTKTYTGVDISGTTITGVGFQPDLTWIKNTTIDFHVVTDAVRLATNYLKTDAATAEITSAQSLQSFDSDGYTIGNIGEVNTSGDPYASWNWKANGSGSANTVGDIDSTVSVNTTAGFSIVKYTGTNVNGDTVGHGLGAAPGLMFIKQINESRSWAVYQKSLSPTKGMLLDTAAVAWTTAGYFNDTATTSTVFSLGTYDETNKSGGEYIAYCWAEKPGFSKFGKYKGNGNADGTFVYTGFRPAFFLTKASAGTTDWFLVDNKRLGYNPDNDPLFPNGTGGKSDVNFIELVSNGAKMRNTSTEVNSAQDYIYIAFAESPLVSSNDIPGVAR